MKVMTMYINNSDIMYGGAYKRYMELINGFLLNGWEVHHISPHRFSNIHHENLNHHGISLVNISPLYIPFLIQGTFKALQIGRKTKIDAFVTFSFFDAFIGIIFKIFNADSKVIYCDRGDTIKGIMIGVDKRFNNRTLSSFVLKLLNGFEKFIFKRIDQVIFNSRVRRDEINAKFELDSSKVEIIYNNANPSWVLQKMDAARKESKFIKEKWNEKRIICFVGNLYIEGRDLETILKAFKKVNMAVPNTVLLMVGEGPDKQRLMEIINSLDLDGSVFIEGWKDNPFSYMLASDVNIVSALHEGCSNTILESIYCENVIIGSDIGGIARLLKYQELLFPIQDPDKLSLKVIKLLEDDDELQEARELVKKRKDKFVFDWDGKMTEAVEKAVK